MLLIKDDRKQTLDACIDGQTTDIIRRMPD